MLIKASSGLNRHPLVTSCYIMWHNTPICTIPSDICYEERARVCTVYTMQGMTVSQRINIFKGQALVFFLSSMIGNVLCIRGNENNKIYIPTLQFSWDFSTVCIYVRMPTKLTWRKQARKSSKNTFWSPLYIVHHTVCTRPWNQAIVHQWLIAHSMLPVSVMTSLYRGHQTQQYAVSNGALNPQ